MIIITGVIQFKKSVIFEARINKIEMIDENYVPKTNDHVIMVGYTEHNVTTLKYPLENKFYLQQVNSTIHDFEKCRKLYQERDGIYIERENRRFCVNLRDGRGNLNHGDSGCDVTLPSCFFNP